jgi:UDP-2-acetamido-3-amino-2,3-dideoxy-glucuronate N-acetyltransferase
MPRKDGGIDPLVHPTAIVDGPGTHVGDGTRIWHFAHVLAGAWIGDRCSIGQGCFIAKVRIGHGCRIQNHVSVFEGVTLEDDVFLGPSCVFTNVKHPRAHVPRKASYARTLVCKGTTIGANATILCGVTIGEYAMIGAGAVVTADVPPHALVVGTPGRRAGWVCRCGETLPAHTGTAADHELRCERCGDHYAELDGQLELLPEARATTHDPTLER